MADETLRQPTIMRSVGTTFDAALMFRDNGDSVQTGTVVHGPLFVGKVNRSLWVVVDVEAISGGSTTFSVGARAGAVGGDVTIATAGVGAVGRVVIPITVGSNYSAPGQVVAQDYLALTATSGANTINFSAHIATTPPGPG